MRTQNSDQVFEKLGRHSCLDTSSCELALRTGPVWPEIGKVAMHISRPVWGQLSTETSTEPLTLVHWAHDLRRNASSLTATVR